MATGSIVWEFFTKKSDSVVECKLCHHPLKRTHRSTSNLKRHIQARHPIEFEMEEEKRKPSFSLKTTTSTQKFQAKDYKKIEECVPEAKKEKPGTSTMLKQQTVTEAIERRQKYMPGDQRKTDIDSLILNMIIKDTQPMSIVEDEGFLELINYLNPRYEMIARSTIRDKRLPALYNLKKAEIMKEMSEALSVAVTTDSWTSHATQSYTTITAHYIDTEWKQKSKVLYTRSNGKAHTSANLEDEMKSCFVEFGIENKVNFIVTDNASNITKAASDLKTNHPCLAHTLNLAVKDALKETGTQALVAKVKAIVAHFKKSPKQVEKLKAVHAENKTKFIKLKQECETRWNSTLDMLESYIKQHTEVTGVLCKGGKAHLCLIENDETDEIKEIKQTIETLKPLKEATLELSGEKFTTLSKVVPMITALKRSICKQQNPLALALQTELSYRFDDFVNEDYLNLTMVLDPRFKSKSPDAAIYMKVKELFPREDTATTIQANPAWEKKVKESSYWQEWDQDMDTDVQDYQSKADQELQYYAKMPNLQRSCDPLIWWQAQSHALPEMTKLARRYLCIPATSVPSERVFSKTGEIISKRRASIKPKNVDMLIFLNKNF